jgi:hypothetical protein
MDKGKKTFRSPNRGGGGRRGFKSVGFVALLILFAMIVFAAIGRDDRI